MAAPAHVRLEEQVYHHVVLPRDVPGRAEENLASIDADILQRLIVATKAIAPFLPENDRPLVDRVRLALSTAKILNVDGHIDKPMLIQEFRNLEGNNVLILYIQEQNAALLIYRDVISSSGNDDEIIFEVFETSAACEEVLASENALLWDFPGQAVAVPSAIFTNDSFQESLASFLQQASMESIKQFSAVTFKAAATLPEIRDTSHPTLISEVLIALLQGTGRCQPSMLLRKRVRDTVSFSNASKPWRRSSFYLVLRVGMQRHLYKDLGPEVGRLYFKTIMCLFLSHFLDDSHGILTHEMSHYLRLKLGRRLAKLEVDRDRINNAKDQHDILFGRLRAIFDTSLTTVGRYLNQQWNEQKERLRRPILPLPQYAHRDSLQLSLPVSGNFLQGVLRFDLERTSQLNQSSGSELLKLWEASSSSTRLFHSVSCHYVGLRMYEEDDVLRAKASQSPVQLTETVRTYIHTVGDAYVDYPLMKGRMLLHIMELWMALDELAVAEYKLLAEYHPSFEPRLLDDLQLLSYGEMHRLRRVQSYMSDRCRLAGKDSQTIFSSPNKDGFAARYFDNSPRLIKLRTKIEADAELERARKEQEWEASSRCHEELSKQIAELNCVYVTTVNEWGETVHEHQKGCRKHRLKWQAKQLKIRIHEHPLPNYDPAAKSVVFELGCPETFRLYRDATWLILSSFVYPRLERQKSISLLSGYSSLKKYSNDLGQRDISLGSSTKSHLKTHYSSFGFPVAWEDVCRPCGLKWKYFDTRAVTWILADENEPSFAGHFPLQLPQGSPYHALGLASGAWPTSNAILASQTRSPPELNVHEFMAWQSLLLGSHCRWLSLLRELGSTNLNFSTEATWAVVARLIYQVGPTSTESVLRDVHGVLADPSFRSKLFELIRQRLESIKRNWRECMQMYILISILGKVTAVSSKDVKHAAMGLFELAGQITWDWQRTLSSTEHRLSHGVSTFMLWAALLCKRIYFILLTETAGESSTTVRYFLGSSILLQNSLMGNFEGLSPILKDAILNDLLATYNIRSRLQRLILTDCRGSFLEALQDISPIPRRTDFELDYDDHTWWLTMKLLHDMRTTTTVHYNVVSGVLLTNGQQMGALPSEFKGPALRRLFGSDTLHSLQGLPSMIPGMTMTLANSMPNGHWIHLGLRDGNVVVRAQQDNRVLEYIPQNIFHRGLLYDLPNTLVEDCFHWLDLNTGIIQIRQANPWKSRKGNWHLDLNTGRATRGKACTLVDPCSNLFKRATRNFAFFEEARHITVYQDHSSTLTVELKRLELEFFVNEQGMLQSKQLGATIEESRFQDAGTWYGLYSKITVRSIMNPSQRSILVPTGDFQYAREGQHVFVKVIGDGNYVRFGINETLGRIECPAEPMLLYLKVLCHAYTSHFLPDELTGRMGLDEALYNLRTALYQPWNAISSHAAKILARIAELTPTREYYPTDLRCMETIRWNEALTTHIQDDRYRAIIENITTRLSDLALFSSSFLNGIQLLPPIQQGNLHLEKRAQARLYAPEVGKDLIYMARDAATDSPERANVVLLAQALSTWSTVSMAFAQDLSRLFEQFPVVCGYIRDFDKVQISDLLAVDIGLEWGALAQTCLHSEKEDRFRLVFLLAPITFSSDIDPDLVRLLINYSTYVSLKNIKPPDCPSYIRFICDEVPNVEQLSQMMQDAKKEFIGEKISDNKLRGQLAIARLSHQGQAQRTCTQFADSILKQWPSTELDHACLTDPDPGFFDADTALETLQPEWTRLTQNFIFSRYLCEIHLLLLREGPDRTTISDQLSSTNRARRGPKTQRYSSRLRGGEVPTLPGLLEFDLSLANATSPQEVKVECSLFGDRFATRAQHINGYNRETSGRGSPTRSTCIAPKNTSIPCHIAELRELVAGMKGSPSALQQRYGSELEESIYALLRHHFNPKSASEPFNPTKISDCIAIGRGNVDGQLRRIQAALQHARPHSKWLQHVGLWPSMPLVSVLTQLRSTSGIEFGQGVREMLIKLALAVTEYQRAKRIQDAGRRGKLQQLEDEMSNPGHENWDVYLNPDWLLLEIEGDILLRPEQVDVARETIAPSSGENSVLQLLMGKGKTSCILPMVALKLADANRLLRIVVPGALLLQTAQVIQTKVGGLLNRQILHIPFSRKTPTDVKSIRTYFRLHASTKERRGIILAQPEHLLSFKLSGTQRLCDERIEEASLMIQAQSWLNRHSRDVLDECDVSLAIRTQLIYPSGSQMSVDGHPLRWQVIETVLLLVRSFLPGLQVQFPYSIEVVQRTAGGYPLIYFLRADAENHLISQLVTVICAGQTSILPCQEYPNQQKAEIEAFISSAKLNSEIVRRITRLFKEMPHLMKVLYLLRGIFVHRILLSTLKKRWNVQYGLHPDRHPIAVPFLAKGVPSPTSEWGHPDVAIILTCLSFYYDGVHIAQFKQALEHLMKSDEPSIEYEKWATKSLPEALRDFHAINVDDSTQLSELHQHVRYNVFLLDFYLNNFVFPTHAKQFKSKLQASGWDLVLYESTRKGSCQTTGFSGTNETRHQLPMTVKQNDLLGCLHTNAEVLSYLLELRNRRYVRMIETNGSRLSEAGLLRKLLNPHALTRTKEADRIRVLIDAGAQILEHGNKDLAKLWLSIDEDAAAAVFFDSNHRAMVIWGKGKVMPLSASPFAGNLENCLVYIDESHCRGTDLPLPPEARAALTLGPHLTKDALAQAAMRLRLLGKQQSVTFFSPPEVHQSILDLRGNGDPQFQPTSADVIRWLLEQTCNSIEQMEPLYFVQGTNYFKRLQAGIDEPRYLVDDVQRKRYISVVRTDEMQTLKQLYEPRHLQHSRENEFHAFSHAIQAHMSALEQRKMDFEDRGLAIHSSALEEVEQEREIEYEVEEIREVQKPVHFEPHKTRGLQGDIKEFVTSGRLPGGSDAYLPMPSVLQQTAVGKKHGTLTAATIVSKVFISAQYNRTVKVTGPNDNFLRPCQWVLWAPGTETALVVSPEEANRLLPLLQQHEPPSCHLIVYAAPITRKMLHFNELDYYAIPALPSSFKAPAWLKAQLGIFSGRLYFGWDEYHAMLQYLGAGSSSEHQTNGRRTFAKQPLTFLHDWLAVRRKGQDFEHTPMGFVTTGKPLSPNHPFFLSATVEQERCAQAEHAILAALEVDSDSDSDEEHEPVPYGEADRFGVEEANYGYEDDDSVEDHPFFEAGEQAKEEETNGRKD